MAPYQRVDETVLQACGAVLHGYANPLILLNFFKRDIFAKSLI